MEHMGIAKKMFATENVLHPVLNSFVDPMNYMYLHIEIDVSYVYHEPWKNIMLTC